VIGVKTDISDYDFSDGIDGYTAATIFLFTGCAPSVKIGKIEYSYVFEFLPVDNAFIYVNVSGNPAGARTMDLISNVFKMNKNLQTLTL